MLNFNNNSHSANPQVLGANSRVDIFTIPNPLDLLLSASGLPISLGLRQLERPVVKEKVNCGTITPKSQKPLKIAYKLGIIQEWLTPLDYRENLTEDQVEGRKERIEEGLRLLEVLIKDLEGVEE